MSASMYVCLSSAWLNLCNPKHTQEALKKPMEIDNVQGYCLLQETGVKSIFPPIEDMLQPEIEVLLKKVAFVEGPWQPRWVD